MHIYNSYFSITWRLVLVLLVSTASSIYSYQPTQDNLAAREWFQDARFGLFIHWGIYSQLAHGEWVMQNQKMSLENYEQLAPLFNPTKFNAQEWVSLAKAAGMRYITITTKHHDGFAIFHTKQNRWNIVDGTPYGQDVIKQLADECHKQDIKLFFYYSQLDWHHHDYYPRGVTGHLQGRSKTGNWNAYIQFMNAQLTELLTQYGDIAGIWFDGWWDNPDAAWDLKNTFDLIHALQPHALIGSNHHDVPFEGQDFQMFEQDLPGQNSAGFEENAHISPLPLESCVTMTKHTWGLDLIDAHGGKFRTTKEIIHDLAGAAGRNCNLLLNVGPLADGTFPEKAITTLKEIGAWMAVHGESIYQTKSGPLEPRAWGVTTQTADKIYVHLLDWNNGDALWLPIEGIHGAYYLRDRNQMVYAPLNNGILLKNLILNNPYDTVIVLEK